MRTEQLGHDGMWTSDTRRMTFQTGWKGLSITVVLLVSACATNPVTGNREFAFMSESQEIAIGREADIQIQQAPQMLWLLLLEKQEQRFIDIIVF